MTIPPSVLSEMEAAKNIQKPAAPVSSSRFPIREEPGTRNTTEGTPRRSLNLVSAPDLLNEPEEVRRYQWDGLLTTGSINLCAAKPKVGKSTLALQLARCTAAGLPFLGRETRTGPVLYVALEGKRGEFAKSLRALGQPPANLSFHIGPAPDFPIDDLTAAITATGAVLAIIDPLFRFARVTDLSDYAEITNKFAPLEFIARSTGCALLLIHHLSKQDRDDGDQVLGSTAIFAGVDTALTLRRSENGIDRVISSQQRYGDELDPHILQMDETGNLQDVGPKEGHDIRKVRAEIVAALRIGGTLPGSELGDKVSAKRQHYLTAMKGLREEGVVQTTGAGKRGDPLVFSLRSDLAEDAV